jgi:hypothetical protein
MRDNRWEERRLKRSVSQTDDISLGSEKGRRSEEKVVQRRASCTGTRGEPERF